MGKATSKVPERTLKSYCLQEPEAVSRQTKIGTPVIDLRHDGCCPIAASWRTHNSTES